MESTLIVISQEHVLTLASAEMERTAIEAYSRSRSFIITSHSQHNPSSEFLLNEEMFFFGASFLFESRKVTSAPLLILHKMEVGIKILKFPTLLFKDFGENHPKGTL